MKLLAVDAGNSRIKWRLHADGAWRERGWTPTALPQLTTQWSALPRPDRIVVSNVAGAGVADHVAAACRPWAVEPEFIRAESGRDGVENGYAEPQRLGADRWAALIGARHAHPGRELLLVLAGTAVTIDSLDATGRFRGGLILPGINLMLDALAGKTAGLDLRPGKLADFPDNTADAMYSGVLNAVAGAVERRYRLSASAPLCLLGGGDADMLLPALDIPVLKAENLVLEGLLRIALTT